MRKYVLLLVLFCSVMVETNTSSVNAINNTSPLADHINCGAPVQAPGSGDNLTRSQQNAAFDLVMNSQLAGEPPSSGYGQYNFELAANSDKDGKILPVIMKSIAGIESEWTQYRNGYTLHNDTCDFGIMQVNSQSSPSLFTKLPSLRSDTKGNIAAGAVVLKEKWDGVDTNLPAVNYVDPEKIIDWYYALASYNAGPSINWKNNPNCGSVNLSFDCSSFNFTSSRISSTWSRNDPGVYPYQERILYNIQYPTHPIRTNTDSENWTAGNLGLNDTVTLGNQGIKPDDSLFIAPDGTGRYKSTAPNIMLFEHQASLASTLKSKQYITFSYNLPRNSLVTLQILSSASSNNIVKVLHNKVSRLAGWNQDSLLVDVPINSGYAYRIIAESGSTSDPASYYIGKYTQVLRTYRGIARVYVPYAVSGGDFYDGVLNNGNFGEFKNRATIPDKWIIQAIFPRGRKDNNPNSIELKVARQTQPYTHMRFIAVPGGRSEILQQFTVSSPGIYKLTYSMNVSNIINSNSRITARYRPVSQGSWTFIRDNGAGDTGDGRSTYTSTFFLTGSTEISFLATFDQSESGGAFMLDGVSLVRIQ